MKNENKRAYLVLVAVNAGLGIERYYVLQTREQLAKLTEQNRATARINVAHEKDLADDFELIEKKQFKSKDAAVKAADKAGFDTISHQQIAHAAAKLKNAVKKTKAKKR
jgi:hypothetical protein